jgi:heme exporter protein A
MTVGENAAFAAALYGARGDAAVALSRVGLAALSDLPAQYLSAGQRRRLGLARLLVAARPLWLLDEPLAALDRAGKALMAELIMAHCAAGGIVIAATHDPLGVEGPRLVLGKP